jgi:hypothetical protein
VGFAAELQSQNVDRGQRTARLIEADLAALPESPAGPNDDSAASQVPDPAEQQAASERQQLELAQQLLGLAHEQMSQAAEKLVAQASPLVPPSPLVPAEQPHAPREALGHVERAVEHLQALRRLFFSITEHLRETAQRQAGLNDDTEQVAALERGEGLADKTGPLTLRQRELQSITEQISQALDDQAKQQPMPDGQIDPRQLEQSQRITEQFAKAAKLVNEGGIEMGQAAEQLSPRPESADSQGPSSDANDTGVGITESPTGQNAESRTEGSSGVTNLRLDEARRHQDAALQKLVDALSLLQPPQPQQPQQQQQDKKQQTQGESPQSKSQDQEQTEQSAGFDPSGLLQRVRDREAQRRRDREQRGRFEQEPVEKDW